MSSRLPVFSSSLKGMSTTAAPQTVGRIVQIIGPVVDVEFDTDALPELYNALEIRGKTDSGATIRVVAEVQQHIGRNQVRAGAMSTTDGVVRGMDAIDTAPVYGFGHSERVIGEALRGLRVRPLLMTKVGLRWDDARGPVFFESQDNQKNPVTVRRNLRADSVRFEVEQSQKRLGVDVLDDLGLDAHEVASAHEPSAEPGKRTPLPLSLIHISEPTRPY